MIPLILEKSLCFASVDALQVSILEKYTDPWNVLIYWYAKSIDTSKDLILEKHWCLKSIGTWNVLIVDYSWCLISSSIDSSTIWKYWYFWYLKSMVYRHITSIAFFRMNFSRIYFLLKWWNPEIHFPRTNCWEDISKIGFLQFIFIFSQFLKKYFSQFFCFLFSSFFHYLFSVFHDFLPFFSLFMFFFSFFHDFYPFFMIFFSFFHGLFKVLLGFFLKIFFIINSLVNIICGWIVSMLEKYCYFKSINIFDNVQVLLIKEYRYLKFIDTGKVLLHWKSIDTLVAWKALMLKKY